MLLLRHAPLARRVDVITSTIVRRYCSCSSPATPSSTSFSSSSTSTPPSPSTSTSISPSPSTLVRVRYAPSPTGWMHLGGLRTALYNYLFAKKSSGTFILRIEDTDKNRFVQGATDNIIDALKWAGLDFNEGPGVGGEYGPYVQSERSELYKQHANALIEKGNACFCSSERLDSLRSKQLPYLNQLQACLNLSEQEIADKVKANTPHTIRLKVPRNNEDILVKDGDTTFNVSSVDDQVLLKSDGFPTYHLASVVDDHLMKVIRGEEWLTSAPKHILIYRAFGWSPPLFAHLPLLLNSDKTKLSKRHGNASVESYQQQGYLPSAVVNFVSLLGWGPPNITNSAADEIFFSLPSLVEAFSLSSVALGGSVVNMEKLYWINTQQSGITSLVALLRPIINASVIKHISQHYYSSPNALYFMNYAPQVPIQVPPKLPTKSPASSKSNTKVDSTKAPPTQPELPTGMALEAVILTDNMKQHHPNLEKLFDDSYVKRVVETVRERLHVVGDIGALSLPFFAEPEFVSPTVTSLATKAWSPSLHQLISPLYEKLQEVPEEQWQDSTISAVVKQFSKEKGVKVGEIFNALRLLVMGSAIGAGVPASLATLGKSCVLFRLNRAIQTPTAQPIF